jgi:hypothetical protein
MSRPPHFLDNRLTDGGEVNQQINKNISRDSPVIQCEGLTSNHRGSAYISGSSGGTEYFISPSSNFYVM